MYILKQFSAEGCHEGPPESWAIQSRGNKAMENEKFKDPAKPEAVLQYSCE